MWIYLDYGKLGLTSLVRSFFGALSATSGQNCTRRFFEAMEAYFDAQCQEVDSKEILDLDSYIRFRRDASGCKPCFALIEYVNGLNLPDVIFEDPIVRALQETANDIVSWSNVRSPHVVSFSLI